jgi:hypothetical protein
MKTSCAFIGDSSFLGQGNDHLGCAPEWPERGCAFSEGGEIPLKIDDLLILHFLIIGTFTGSQREETAILTIVQQAKVFSESLSEDVLKVQISGKYDDFTLCIEIGKIIVGNWSFHNAFMT